MSKLNIAGKIGNNFESSKAHIIEIGKNYNGSGGDAFGGAKEWPTVTAKIGFQAHEGQRAVAFAKKLAALIRAEFEGE